VATQPNRLQQEALYSATGAGSAKETRFTQHMLQQAYDDNATIRACKLPSALVEVPRISERYETQSYSQGVAGKDLRALQIVENKVSGQPVLNLNSAFFGAQREGTTVPDAHAETFARQKDFNATAAERNNYIKGLVYHTDMDHPLSFHHQTLDSSTRVAFPPLQSEQQMKNTKLVQNGFYSREPLSLAGAYKGPKESSLVMPLDERFAFNTKDTFQRGTNVFLKGNLLYEPNAELMRELGLRAS
jgi:hypothetical protein